MVEIGHAASTEKGLIISSWYNKPWSFVLRAKDPNVRRKMVDACKTIIRSGKVKYSQAGDRRNTLYQALKTIGFNVSRINEITGPVYCDCSSFMSVCAYVSGVPLRLDRVNAPSTSSMKIRFMDTGMFDLLTEDRYTHSSDYLVAGDILDVPGSHTVMALNNGKDVEEHAPMDYTVGNVYTLDANMKVRTGPGLEYSQKKYSELTTDGRRHAFEQPFAVFKKGTRITCKEVFTDNYQTWIRCPSGWVCAVLKDKVYVV